LRRKIEVSDPKGKSIAEFSDERLVELYRQGRADAFKLLVQRYRNSLFHFLVRFVGQRPAAEDVFQETFLQVHLSIETFDATRSFRPWVFTIAANKARDWLRRNSQRQAAPLSAPIDGASGEGRTFVDLLQADLPMPSQTAESQEVQQLVKESVAELPDHLREILLLAYFDQFAYKEIAHMLGVPLGTVKSRLHSAVATFGAIWKRKYEHGV
jgi:RNA polymerase sigma-70 factor (ECF subfamily)